MSPEVLLQPTRVGWQAVSKSRPQALGPHPHTVFLPPCTAQAQVYFPDKLYDMLEDALISYGETHLGCRAISPIWMSYYVDGCVQVGTACVKGQQRGWGRSGALRAVRHGVLLYAWRVLVRTSSGDSFRPAEVELCFDSMCVEVPGRGSKQDAGKLNAEP